jgi:cation transporter-like permease
MARSVNSRAFLTGFKETLTGHFVGIGGLIAGAVVAWQLGVFRSVPWAIAIYPTVLTAKAVINGLFSGRLNTALHVGTVSPKFFGNTKTLGLMFQRIIALTLATSVVMSVVSTVFASLFLGVALSNFLDVLAVVVATMSLGLSTYLLTIPITFSAFKKGLDLDDVAYPIAATIADVAITVCYALTVNLFFHFGYPGKYAVILIAVSAAVLALYSLSRGFREERFSKTLRVSLLSLMLVAVISSVTGTILQRINVVAGLWNGNNAAIFVTYPALIELIGDSALVIGSTATTRLVLGLMEPHFSAVKNHAPQIIGAWTASAIAFIPISVASLFLTGTFGLPAFYLLTSVLLATNVLAMIAMTLISFALAILTFKKGLDPDHLVVPTEVALSGTITSTALLAAMFLLLHLAG